MSLLLLFQDDGTTPQGWQAPLSNVPPTVATTVAAVLIAASAGFSVPLTPPAAAAATSVGIPVDSGGTPPRINRVYHQTRSEPLTPPLTPVAVSYTVFGWHQSLSVPPPVAKAHVGFSDVPYNTAQIVVTPASAIGIPLNAGDAPPRKRLVYHQARSDPPYVAPVAAAGVAGMAWFTPLWSVPMRNLVAQQGHSFVPLNTTQIVVTTPGRRRPTLFIANVGRLMN